MKSEQTRDAALWRSFTEEQHSDHFLQSWDWGEFQIQSGRQLIRLIVRDSQIPVLGCAQAVLMPLPFGRRYLYLPRGPVFRAEAGLAEKRAVIRVVARELQDLASKNGAGWLRFEPPFFQNEEISLTDELRGEHRVRHLGQTVQPQSTQILDLKQSEEALLGAMHQKTRYNIRLAEKKGVRISVDDRPEAFEEFWRLMEITAQRNRIHNHPRAYYETMYRTLRGSDRQCRIRFYRAEYRNASLAMMMCLSYGRTATYLHGASSNEERNVMAPYLMQWQAIRDAKAAGALTYDFWGVTTSQDPQHHWAGISKFKLGFGGRTVSYAPAIDLVFRPALYHAYRLLKKVLK